MQKAKTILAEVRKAPGEFASIAKPQSQDTGSAELGGELGSFQKGTKSDLPPAALPYDDVLLPAGVRLPRSSAIPPPRSRA